MGCASVSWKFRYRASVESPTAPHLAGRSYPCYVARADAPISPASPPAPAAARRAGGRALLADLIERARALGHHTILAGISAEQTASVALHDAFGFVKVAHFRELGFKHGQWLDVIYVQLLLELPLEGGAPATPEREAD